MKVKMKQIRFLKMDEKIDLKYETKKYIYDSQQFKAIRSFRDSIFNGKVTKSEVNNKQSNLL